MMDGIRLLRSTNLTAYPDKRNSPYYIRYWGILKDARGNRGFRKEVLRWGSRSKRNAEELWIMCSRDLLFWANAFLFVFNPQKKLTLPFITYDYQDRLMLEMQAAVGERPLLVEKARQLGVTWNVLAVAKWFYDFSPTICSFLLTSHKEEKVDKIGKNDTLFGRLDFIQKHLPRWLKPETSRVHLLMTNERTGSTIAGEATTGKAGRSENYTAVIPDEFAMVEPPADQEMVASVVPMTPCTIYVSTPNGVGNEFERKRNQPGMDVKTVHWSLHPEYQRGLYRVGGHGRVEILDEGYAFPADYPFNQPYPGKFELRSPWFDRKCVDMGSLRLILQELEIVYHGSGSEVFDTEVLQRVLENDVRAPYRRGRLNYEPRTCRMRGFVDDEKGNLKLWVNLDGMDRPARSTRYVVGCDISRGTGASMSCASVVDRMNGEKVASYKTALRAPHEFAEDVVALCRWFSDEEGHPAFLIWEDGGPGQTFGQTVQDLRFANFYYHRQEHRVDKKRTLRPGYCPANRQLKNAVIDALDQAYGKGTFINRCEEDVRAAFQYKLLMDGSIEHSGARTADDPADARENHGDAVVADAMANHVLQIYATNTVAETTRTARPGSFLARRLERLRAVERDVVGG